MPNITLYNKRKLHLAGLVAWEMRLKRCRRVCKSQNVCPKAVLLYVFRIAFTASLFGPVLGTEKESICDALDMPIFKGFRFSNPITLLNKRLKIKP